MKITIDNLTINQNISYAGLGELNCYFTNIYTKLEIGVNFLVGPLSGSAWALSYYICKGNNKYTQNDTDCVIKCNDKEIKLNGLKKLSYYVGEFSSIDFSVKTKIKYALLRSNLNFTYKQITEMFMFEDTYLKRKLKQLSHNKWIYSFAIGFSQGKKIFCFPWMTAESMSSQLYRLSVLANIAEENDLCLIIPVEDCSFLLSDENKFEHNNIYFN